MNAAAFRVLKDHAGQEATLIGTPDGAWPEIVIPCADAAPAARGAVKRLEAGQIVRVVGYPRAGAVGRVRRVPTRPRRVDSGALAFGAEVSLLSGDTLFVPWTNLELVEVEAGAAPGRTEG